MNLQRNPFDGLQPVKVRLADIAVDRMQQVRAMGESIGVIRRYRERIERGSEPPPVLIARTKRKGQILVDGFHRIEALRQVGRKFVWALIADIEVPEARWFGSEFNADHGVALTKKDHRRRLKFYVDAGFWTDPETGSRKALRTIAIELGGVVHWQTIHAWMKKDRPSVARHYNVPGRQRQTPPNIPGQSYEGEKDNMGINLEQIESFYRVASQFNPEDRAVMAEALTKIAAKLREPDRPKKGKRSPSQSHATNPLPA
jgi:hypothetical protein